MLVKLSTCIKTSITCLIIGVISTIIFINKTTPEQEIKIVEVEKEDTKWKNKYLALLKRPPVTKEECDEAWECAKSPLIQTHETKKDYLYVTTSDKCKSIRMGYKIKLSNYPKNFFQGGLGYDYKGEIAYTVGYLRALNRKIAIGGSLVLVERNKPAGFVKIQVGF